MRKILDRITGFFTVSLLSVMVVMAIWQVFTRFILKSPSTTSEEFLRFSLIWLTMVGGAYVYGKNQHLAVVFVARKFPKAAQAVIGLFVEACVMLFSIVILILGGANAFKNAIGQVSPALRLPMEYLYLSLVVGGVLFLIYSLINLYDLIIKKRHMQTPEEKY